jgi:hypothetical protein
VQERGDIAWKGYQHVFVSEVLRGERIGLLPIDDRYYRLYLASFPLARFDSRSLRVERLRTEDLATAD